MAVADAVQQDDSARSVSRPDSIDASTRTIHRDWLHASIGDAIKATTRDEIEGRRIQNELAVVAGRLFADDPAAGELVKKSRVGISAYQDPPRHTWRGVADWEVPLGEGTTILVPPYDDGDVVLDHAQDAPNNASNPGSGTCRATVTSSYGEHFASSQASLSIWFIAGKTGTLEVRPFIKYDGYGRCDSYGFGSVSAWTGAQVHAIASINGQTIDQRSPSRLWDETTVTSGRPSAAGIMWPPDVGLRFPVQSGELYAATVVAVAMRDLTDGDFGWSTASSVLTLDVPFITLELN